MSFLRKVLQNGKRIPEYVNNTMIKLQKKYWIDCTTLLEIKKVSCIVFVSSSESEMLANISGQCSYVFFTMLFFQPVSKSTFSKWRTVWTAQFGA